MFEVNEELWFGDSDDAAAEQNAAESMAAMVGRILGAKPFPVAAKRLEELTRSPSTRIEQIVRVLEGDPALSARLLRLVNSAGYALRLRCTSVRHAAALVGMRRLHQVATTAAVLDMFDANSDAAVEILEHASVVGSFCRYLGVHLGLPRDELFTCGFLHDIGKLMLLDTEGAAYADLLVQYGGVADGVHTAERARYGFDHAVLAAHVLAAWNIPDPVPKVIAWHHNIARAYQADGTTAAMVQALRLADALSYVVGKTADYDAVVQIASSEAAVYLEISEPQLAAMWDDLVALRQHSRVGARGSDVSELVIMPRKEPVLRPSNRPGGIEAPRHLPCVACKKPSFGNTCPCCEGHVCPDHQTQAGEWCVLCVREFARVRAADVLDTSDQVQLTLWASVIALLSGWGAASVPGAGTLELILGPALVLGVSGVVYGVGRRWRQRSGFMQARRKRPRSVDAESLTERTAVPSMMPSVSLASALSVAPARRVSVAPKSLRKAPSERPSATPEPRAVQSQVPSRASARPRAEPAASVRPAAAARAHTPEPHTVAPAESSVFPKAAPSAPPPPAVAQPREELEPYYDLDDDPEALLVVDSLPPVSRRSWRPLRPTLGYEAEPRPVPNLSSALLSRDLLVRGSAMPASGRGRPSTMSDESVPSVRIPRMGPLPVIVTHESGSRARTKPRSAPAISIRFSTAPEDCDSIDPPAPASEPEPVMHVELSTWEHTSERP